MGFSKLPVGRGVDHVRAFIRLGWELRRQEGSHHILTKPGHRTPLSVPCHNKDMKQGTLRRLLRDARIGEDEYVLAFKKKPPKGTKKKP